MVENTIANELIYEVLKRLQIDIDDMKHTLGDHTRQLIGIREAINELRGQH